MDLSENGMAKKKKRVYRVIIIYLVLIKIGTNWSLSWSFQFSDSDQLSKAPEPVEAAVQCPHSSTTWHDVKKNAENHSFTAASTTGTLDWGCFHERTLYGLSMAQTSACYCWVFTYAKRSWCPLENEACNSTRPVWTLRLLQKRP